MKRLITVLFLILLPQLLLGNSEYPALYQAGNFRISTLEQVFKRWKNSQPTFTHDWRPLEEIEYKGELHSGYVLHTDGIKNNIRHQQILTYINYLPGLLRLVYVDSKDCITGKAINLQGEWEDDWRCTSTDFPLRSYSDTFILENDQVDISELSKAWKKEITPIQDDFALDQDDLPTESLGDLKRFILNKKGTWQVTPSEWHGSLYKPLDEPEPALLVSVESQVDDFTVKQSFLYLIDDNHLRLKEIDGVLCRYVERVQKEICDPVYHQTPATPFPMNLLNTLETSDVISEGRKPTESPVARPELLCGELPNNLNFILRTHFERSIFGLKDVREYRRVFKNFVLAADPSGLLLSAKTQQKYLESTNPPYSYDFVISKWMQEMNKGPQGNCSVLVPYIDELRDEVLEKSAQAISLFEMIKANNFDLSLIRGPELTSTQERILESMLTNPLPGFSDKESLDVLSQKRKRYLTRSLDRLSDPEWFVTAAMARQDVYSIAFENDQQTQVTLNGQFSNLYYGVAIETGLSGAHYFGNVHPAVERNYGIKLGDKIVTINGAPSQELKYEQFDSLLLDKQNPIDLVVENKQGQTFKIKFSASQIDPLDAFYELELLEGEGENQFLKIKLKSFEAGLAKKIKGEITEIEKQNPVYGYVLDLKDNAGGTSLEAINIMSMFVKDTSVALFTIGSRFSGQIRDYQADPQYFINDEKPVVILVDDQSKSASEIVAGSLKDMGRAVVVGTRTFGKLVNQYYSQLQLSNGMEIGSLITSLEFYSPLGTSRNGLGVFPDIVVEEPNKKAFQDGNSPGKDLDLASYEGKVKHYSTPWSLKRLADIQSQVRSNSLSADTAALVLLQGEQPTRLAESKF